MIRMNRRTFGLGAGVVALSLATGGRAALANETRSVTTAFGTYDIPTNPQRVIAIDNRIDLETALALGLPVIGYCRDVVGPWVEVPTDAVLLSNVPNVEQILALEPDLIICSDWGDNERWPWQRLQSVAPVLPITTSDGWRANIANISQWLGIEGRADEAIAEFDAVVSDIRAQHGPAIDSKRVLALHYFPEDQNMKIRGQGSNQALVLSELGGTTINPTIIEEGDVSMEVLPDMLADIDGILYAELADQGTYEAVQAHPQWSRIPAVAAGKVHVLRGATNFGGVYAAKYVAQEWAKLYAMLEA